jgi:hypothetical protein
MSNGNRNGRTTYAIDTLSFNAQLMILIKEDTKQKNHPLALR